MDDRRPPLSGGNEGEPPAPRAPERPRTRRPHGLPLLVGVLIGAAAIAAALVLVLRDGSAEPQASPGQAAASDGAAEVLTIIFPEGFTRAQMAERIAAVNEIALREREIATSLSPDEYLFETRRSTLSKELGASRARSLEGFLFPATYEFTERTTASELVRMQLDAFQRAWAKVDLTKAEKRNLTPYDVLIIASMIEGEVRVPKERRLVAAVIYNRLRARMPLGIDATLRYGLEIPPDESITRADLESDSPYNTRKRTGLPPTPINNPGLAAMRAAANPASVDYLYYARKKDCKSHFFTASFEEFEKFLDGPRC